MEDITQFFSLPLHVAAALHKMSICDFKRLYNSKGIKRWPYNKYKNQKKNMGGFEDFQININSAKKQKPIDANDAKETPVVSFNLDFEDFCKSLSSESQELFSLFETECLFNEQYLKSN
jgi:hypothetical protein